MRADAFLQSYQPLLPPEQRAFLAQMAGAWDEALLRREIAPTSRKTAALYLGARIAVGEALGESAAEARIDPQVATYEPVDDYFRLRPSASNAPVTTWTGGTSWLPVGDTWLHPVIQPARRPSASDRVIGPLGVATHMISILSGGVTVHRLDPEASPSSILWLEEIWQQLIAARLAARLAYLLSGRNDAARAVVAWGIETAFSAANAQQNAISSLQDLLLCQDIAQRDGLLSAMSSLSRFDVAWAFKREFGMHLPG
jgi:hypothetical protein